MLHEAPCKTGIKIQELLLERQICEFEGLLDAKKIL